MKTFEVRLRIRNNRLVQRREELGLTPRQLADQAGVDYGAYLALESMKTSPLRNLVGPFGKKWEGDPWIKIARSLERFHGVSVEELFPQAVLEIKRTSAVAKMDAGDFLPPHPDEIIQALPSYSPQDEAMAKAELSDQMRKLLGVLTDEQREIVERVVVGDERISDISRTLATRRTKRRGVVVQGELSRTRVGQILDRSMRKLRYAAEHSDLPPT